MFADDHLLPAPLAGATPAIEDTLVDDSPAAEAAGTASLEDAPADPRSENLNISDLRI